MDSQRVQHDLVTKQQRLFFLKEMRERKKEKKDAILAYVFWYM